MVLPGLRSLKSLLGSSNKRGNSGRKHKEKNDAYVVVEGGGGPLRVSVDVVTDLKDKGSCKVAGHHQVHPENHTIDNMMDGGDGSIGDNRKQDSLSSRKSVGSKVVSKVTVDGGGGGGGHGLPSFSTSSPPILPYDNNEMQQKKSGLNQNGPSSDGDGSANEKEKENLLAFVRCDRANNRILTSWDSSSSNLRKSEGQFRPIDDLDNILDNFGENSEKRDPVKECLERRVKELEKLLEDERRRVAELEKEKTVGRLKTNDTDHHEPEQKKKRRSFTEEDKWKAECEAYETRVARLQDEMRKKDLVMQNILKFQSKLRQISREKSSIQMLYERKLHNCQLNIARLEKLNKLLICEIKNLESVASAVGSLTSCRFSAEGRDRTANGMPLERMKYLEAENCSLVVENEQQRMQYEKCLDDVANQVVQALLVQKSLQGECSNLRKHVTDLEQQNQTLHILFQQQLQRTCDQRIQFGGSFTLPDTRISTGFHCLPRTSHSCANDGFCPIASHSMFKRDEITSPIAGRSLSCTSIGSDGSTVETPSNRPLKSIPSLRDKDKLCESAKMSLSEPSSQQQKSPCQFVSSSSHWRRQNRFSCGNEGCWTEYCSSCVGGGGGECCCLQQSNCHSCCSCDDYCSSIRSGRVTRSLPRNGTFEHRPKRRPASHSLVMGMADLFRLNGLKNRTRFLDETTAPVDRLGLNARCNCRFGLTTVQSVSARTCEPIGYPTRFTMGNGDVSRLDFERKNDCHDGCKSSLFRSNSPLELELINSRYRSCGDYRPTTSCELHRKQDARRSLILNVMQETVIQPTVVPPPAVGWNDKCNCNPHLMYRDGWNDCKKSSLQNGTGTCIDGSGSDLLSKESVSFDKVDTEGNDTSTNENFVRDSCDVTPKESSSVTEDRVESEQRSPTILVGRDEGYSTMSSDVQCDVEVGDRSKREFANTSPEFFTFKHCESDSTHQMHLDALVESQEPERNEKEVEKSETMSSLDVKEVGEVIGSSPDFNLDWKSIVEGESKSRSSESCLVESNPGEDDDRPSNASVEKAPLNAGVVRRSKSEGDVSLLSKQQLCSNGCGSALDVTGEALSSSSRLHRSKGCLSLTEDVVSGGGGGGDLHLDTRLPVDEKTFASLPDDDDEEDDDWFMVENLDCLQDCCSTPECQVAPAVNCYSDEEICNWSLNLSTDDICNSPKKLEDSDDGRCSVKRSTNQSLFWSQPSSGSLPSIQEVDVEWDFFSSLPSKARLIHLRFLKDRECRRLWRKIRRRDGACKSWPCETENAHLRPREAREMDSLGGWDSSASCVTSKGISMSSVTDEEQFGGNSNGVLPVSTPSSGGEEVKTCAHPPQSSEEGDRSPVETRFKSDFYMLCKVESCRSLDVSCKNLVTSDSGSYECRSNSLGIDFLQALASRRGKRSNGDGSFLVKGITRSNERPIVLVESGTCSRKEEKDRVARNLVKKTLHELSVMLSSIEYGGYEQDEDKEKSGRDGVMQGSSGRNSKIDGQDPVCSQDDGQPTDSSSVKEGLTTSWVHFETDVDLSDPKARANLLDSMLASSASSSEVDSSSSISSEEEEEEEEGEEEDVEVSKLVDRGEQRSNGHPTNCKYQQLHEIHRIRRFKRAATDRDQCVVRYIPSPRPSILDRKDFFYRYGEKEQEAVASFDFLESMSTSISDVGGSLETLNERGHGSPRRCSRDTEANSHNIAKNIVSGRTYDEDDNRNHHHHRGPIQVTGGEGFSDGRTKSCRNSIGLYHDFATDRMNLSVLTLTSQEDIDAGERLSLSDSCAESFSCSSSSLNLDV